MESIFTTHKVIMSKCASVDVPHTYINDVSYTFITTAKELNCNKCLIRDFNLLNTERLSPRIDRTKAFCAYLGDFNHVKILPDTIILVMGDTQHLSNESYKLIESLID